MAEEAPQPVVALTPEDYEVRKDLVEPCFDLASAEIKYHARVEREGEEFPEENRGRCIYGELSFQNMFDITCLLVLVSREPPNSSVFVLAFREPPIVLPARNSCDPPTTLNNAFFVLAFREAPGSSGNAKKLMGPCEKHRIY